jgi:hypothetical protein
MKAHGDGSGERSEQNESHGDSDSAAPQEGVLRMDISTRGLAHERGAAETPPLELPEGPASLSSLGEVAYEDTCFQLLSLHHYWVKASRHCDGFLWAGICDATSERPSGRVSHREEMLVSHDSRDTIASPQVSAAVTRKLIQPKREIPAQPSLGF